MYKPMISRILISVLLVLATVFLLVSNVEFCAITVGRYLAIDSAADFGWHDSDVELYNDSIRLVDEFSEKGDYQEWLVSSGSTFTGKIVRTFVMVTTLCIFLLGVTMFIANTKRLFRKIYRNIRKSVYTRARAT